MSALLRDEYDRANQALRDAVAALGLEPSAAVALLAAAHACGRARARLEIATADPSALGPLPPKQAPLIRCDEASA